jgi:hypothetical protein
VATGRDRLRNDVDGDEIDLTSETGNPLFDHERG